MFDFLLNLIRQKLTLLDYNLHTGNFLRQIAIWATFRNYSCYQATLVAYNFAEQ